MILERVRSGREVRLYDPAGFDMTLRRTSEADAEKAVAAVSATLLGLLRARGDAPGGESLTLVDYGEWTWLRHLDGETLDEFLSELIDETIIACREQDATGLSLFLDRWRQEAEAHGLPDV